MTHQHKYDAEGKQLCCTLEEKIACKTNNDTGCCSSHSESENHSDDEHDHDHSNGSDSVFKMFLPAIISFVLLVDCYCI